MRIIAYTYEADAHCIDCTRNRFADWPNARIKWTHEVDVNGVWNDSQFPTLDNEGNEIHPLFSTDEWYDINKPSVFADGTCDHDWDWQCVCNDDQHLICGDCHEIIETYTIESGVTA
jgi:hypothetical protein